MPVKLTLLLSSGHRVNVTLAEDDPLYHGLIEAAADPALAMVDPAPLRVPLDEPAGAVLHVARCQIIGLITYGDQGAGGAAPPSGAPRPQAGPSLGGPALAGGPSAGPGAQPTPVLVPPATRALPARWQEWLAQNLMRGAQPGELAGALAAHGQDPAAARALCDELAQGPALAAGRALHQQLRKRDWLLSCYQRLERAAERGDQIPRRHRLSADEFFARYYTAHRPVILTGLFDEDQDDEVRAITRALAPAALRQRFADVEIEVQAGRDADALFEENAPRLRRRVRFADFIEQVEHGPPGNDVYLTAQNTAANAHALGALLRAPAALDGYLDRQALTGRAFLWYGPAGTVTPLHHDRTNNLIAQVRGRKRVRVVSSYQLPHVYNLRGVFSPLDLDRLDDAQTRARYPLAQRLHVRSCVLAPGELLFIPVGAWHDVRALDVSVSLTYTAFRCDNHFSDHDGSRASS